MSSWNPNPDGLLTKKDPQKCLYGTLGVMAPDVLCLQETIWKPSNFLQTLMEVKSEDRHFIFPQKMSTFQHSTKEAAILYNPEKLKVDNQVAAQANAAWRVRVQSLRERKTPGEDNENNDWRRVQTTKDGVRKERTVKLEDRTVALQGKVVSTNNQIIIISIHMFSNRSGYSNGQIQTLSTEIVSEAQELANQRNMTVILNGDWNCKIKNIELSAGAVMPKPLNPFNDNTEDDGNDSVILINPTARARAGDGPAAAGANGPAGLAGPARAAAGAEAAAEPRAEAAAAAGVAARAAPEPPKLKLDNVHFFKWSDKVTAADMGGELQPADIDAIYCRGGKHRPIVANVKIEQIVADNMANNAN